MTGQSSRSVADVIAEGIASAGVPIAFGHPGGEVALLIDALHRAGVPFLLTRHENTAAFMALGMGELTGHPGVCLATLGPGATNMVTGVASALLERAPLIALTGAVAQGAPYGTTHQALELNQLYTPVTKRSIAVTTDNATEAVTEAVSLSRQSRPGPVHLSIPSDVAGSRAAETRQAVPRSGDYPSRVPTNLAAATRLMAKSRRPALVVGVGGLWLDTCDSVRALAHGLNAPVATTPKAKGLFSEEDPLFAGTLEMAGDDLVVDFLSHADALVMVGVDAVEFDKPWRLDIPVVHVDVQPNRDHYYQAEVEVVGDMDKALRALTESPEPSAWTLQEIASHRANLYAYIRRDGVDLHPRDIVDEVRAAMSHDAIATSDVGAHKMLVGQAWPAYGPRTFFMANGLSSMGYSIPVATAARLVYPDRQVVAFVGDGGLGMYLGELETLVRACVDVLIVTFVDGSLELIRRAQLQRSVPTDGVSFGNPDYVALGRALGFQAKEVSTRREVQRALPELMASRGPRLLAVHIDGASYRF